mmetsp:Transcript_32168/g.28226  ORF Transcript_32168/g.28226 Transcript_32168/m.28226 type:complete len:344 (-) Transcript_32168:29-1060(-)|eukprot:CAMPEP_0201579354 /NCGR_PEP_ID=MMETSP0190_2-20130828/26876_1 /ASSEMBLY_ACC=CAM_ASM_000263 /TAXON_ID=37353 /ORGANISM="Rosalina sp." /LENGTH=343 /DNA_ID=CAMNT_0048013689 /DNA_START=19 /DNA_END=1050 /DNA_ORIENTATION=+
MAAEAKNDEGNAEGVRDEITKILEGAKVSELELKNQAVIIDASTSPKDAIKILIEKKVRAAPVVNKNNFIGVLDIRDTLGFAIEAYKKIHGDDDQKAKETNAIEYLTGDSSSIGGKLEDLESVKAKSFHVVNVDDTLFQLASVFAEGCHVAGVVKDKKLVGVMTQGQFFKAVTDRLYDKKKFKTVLVNNCKLQQLSDLKYISSLAADSLVYRDMKAIDVFEEMYKKKRSGLPIVDKETGQLVHNTSASDIKLWLQKGDQSLEVTIEKFINEIRNQSFGDDRFPYCSLQYFDSLQRAIGKLKATGYRRLWIVDQSKPVGVFALTDLFRFIVKYNEKKDDDKDKK